MTPPRDPHRQKLDWSSRLTWHRVGYCLSALWVGGVLIATDGNVRAPLFDYIFIVPLAGWALGLAIGQILGRRKKMPPRV